MNRLSGLTYSDVMLRYRVSSASEAYRYTKYHLTVLSGYQGGDVARLRSLYNQHYLFIQTALDDIHKALVSRVISIPSEICTLLEMYDFLIKCLNLLVPVLESKVLLYDYWARYISFLADSRDYTRVKPLIPVFIGSLMGSAGLVNYNGSVVPLYSTYIDHGLQDVCNPLHFINTIGCYIECLSQSNLGVDFSGLVDVVQAVDDWYTALDEGDMPRRKWLVKHLMQNVEFDNGEDSAKLFGVALLEHAKVCKDASFVQLGVKLVIKKKSPFLIQVLKHLPIKFDQVKFDEDYSCTKQLQWYRKNGCLQGTICLTIESIISYRLLEDMFREKSPQFLLAIHLIANARTSLEKGANDCLENLDMAIKTLDKFDANKNDRGASLFLRGQALCLRALCRYEEPDSSPQAFIQDINDALKMWNESDLIDTNSLILEYTTKLLLFVFDALMKNHNEDSHELLEDILKIIKKSDSKSPMLWQFISHVSHIKSQMIHNHFQNETIDQCFEKKYGAVIEEGEINKKLERMFSYIMNKEVPSSLESACLVAHICYDLAERMFLLGDMNTALKYATEGRKVRYRLIEESSVLPSNTQSGENVYALLMNPSVAAHVWSLTSEEFILPPNGNFICCLMSMHQEATILELLGNEIQALEVLNQGKRLSLGRGSSFFVGRFQAAIGKILRKSQDLKLAEVELKEAEEQCSHISCKKCKILLNVDIFKESIKLIRKKGSVSLNTQGRKDHLESAERMLREELMHSKGFKDWEHSCRYSMLSVLIEIGKDHIYNNRTKEAGDVFLECVKLVYGLSSLPQSHSHTKLSSFVDFFNLIEKSPIKFSFGTQVAQIIYLISWMAYKMSRDTRKPRVDLFYIPIEKLTSSLKLALVLSSEVTELFQKVAQLLAIMYFVSDKEILPAKVTNLQWACFFIQLTVGSGVDYLFSHKLREVYRVSDPDDILHRLTPNTTDLSEFATNFFEDLPHNTILVINIIGNKYIELLKKLLQSFVPLRDDCVALMMVARFNSKRPPLVGLFPVDSARENDEPWKGPWGTHTIVENDEPWKDPWGTHTIVDTIAPDFKRIIEDYQTPAPQPVLDTLNQRTDDFLRRMESWFGGHKYIMLGEPVGSRNLNLGYYSGFVGIGVNDKSHEVSSCEGTSKREPVTLVLEKGVQMFPWERTHASKDQTYYRMPSVSSTFYSYYTCDESGRNIDRHSAPYAILDPCDSYYFINPNKSKIQKQCADEEQLAKYFKEQLQLEGSLWKHIGADIVDILKTRSFFMYAGHSDGLKYIPEGGVVLRTLSRCASASLMGCSSAMLVLTGPYNPKGAPIEYLLAGSRVVIGNLYDIYTDWAGYFYHMLFTTFKDKMFMAADASIGSCLVKARNLTPLLLLGCGTVIYGVPTRMEQNENSPTSGTQI